jgi:phage baseplate assembly protein W
MTYFADIQLNQRQIDNTCNQRQGVDLCLARGDLILVSGKENVAQAIINRLLTRRGELAALGHPEYGSRLFTLIGEPHNARSQALAEMYIRECLEPRIEELEQFIVRQPDRRSEQRDQLDISLQIKLVANAVGQQQRLLLAIPVVL